MNPKNFNTESTEVTKKSREEIFLIRPRPLRLSFFTPPLLCVLCALCVEILVVRREENQRVWPFKVPAKLNRPRLLTYPSHSTWRHFVEFFGSTGLCATPRCVRCAFDAKISGILKEIPFIAGCILPTKRDTQIGRFRLGSREVRL